MRLNNTTQKAKKYIKEYNDSTCYSVEYFYNRPSINKIRIEEDIKEKMRVLGGYGYKVLCGNSSFFTCGYLTASGHTLNIETPGNTFIIEL